MTPHRPPCAGAELDRRVAEQVMGWAIVPATGERADGRGRGTDSFHPSTNLADAWEVVERMASDGRNLAMNHTGAQYRCRFLAITGPRIWEWAQNPNDGLTVWNESAPLAIVLAALAATATPTNEAAP